MLYIAFSPLFYSLLIDQSWHLVVSRHERYNFGVPSNPISRIFNLLNRNWKLDVGGLLPKSGCRFLRLDLGKRHLVPWDLCQKKKLPMSGCKNLHVDLGELNRFTSHSHRARKWFRVVHFETQAKIFFFADLLGMKTPKSIAPQIIRNSSHLIAIFQVLL